MVHKHSIKLVDYSINSTLFDETGILDIEECTMIDSSVENGILEENSVTLMNTLVNNSASVCCFEDNSMYFDCTLNTIINDTLSTDYSVVYSEDEYKTAKNTEESLDDTNSEDLERTQIINESENQVTPPINKTYSVKSPGICIEHPIWTSTPIQVDNINGPITSCVNHAVNVENPNTVISQQREETQVVEQTFSQEATRVVSVKQVAKLNDTSTSRIVKPRVISKWKNTETLPSSSKGEEPNIRQKSPVVHPRSENQQAQTFVERLPVYTFSKIPKCAMKK